MGERDRAGGQTGGANGKEPTCENLARVASKVAAA